MFDIIRVIIELLVLYGGIYFLLRFMEGTRGLGILKGLVIALLSVVSVLSILALVLESRRLELVNSKVVEYSIFAGLIIFHPELRRVLVHVGQTQFIKQFVGAEETVIDQLIKAIGKLSNTRTGALIALERADSLATFIEAGTVIDSTVSSDLICTIFYNGSPLHDGAVIIQGNRVASAGSLFPLTENPQAAPGLGTRHKAGVGMTEATDAVVLIVSEETGRMSYAVRGQLIVDISLEKLRQFLSERYGQKEVN